ncbi:MAG: deoxyribodipyrimidine photo-lyase [Chloroflexota bacterium]
MEHASGLWEHRLTRLNDVSTVSGKAVVYWMQRSHRSVSNLALNYAVERARDLGQPVLVYFALDASYPMATERAYAFMLEGLRDVEIGLAERNVGFVVRCARTADGIADFAREVNASIVVTDESHLLFGRRRRTEAAAHLARLCTPLLQVDNDALVPVRSPAREYVAAHAIRKSIQTYRDRYLLAIADTLAVQRPPDVASDVDTSDIDAVLTRLGVDRSIARVSIFPGGQRVGRQRLRRFVVETLERYHSDRNNPVLDGTSGLSPYLHFGHLDPWTVALAVGTADAPEESRASYLDELLVRRELASNFTFYNADYASVDGLPAWALATLRKHQADPRPALYTLDALASAETGDDLWNAAQRQLLASGTMHGYMRMYWGKQIITWTRTPEEAMSHTLYLNNLYALDGRDPVSYANVAWCLGKHDRPWPERAIFGSVRSMTRSGAERKFDVRAYIARVDDAPRS